MNLGGIQMDALVVDEGFWTLDRKSIENAMDILINLSGTSKLVGIITHRDQRKLNQIDEQKVYVSIAAELWKRALFLQSVLHVVSLKTINKNLIAKVN